MFKLTPENYKNLKAVEIVCEAYGLEEIYHWVPIQKTLEEEKIIYKPCRIKDLNIANENGWIRTVFAPNNIFENNGKKYYRIERWETIEEGAMHSFLWTEPQLIPIMGIDTVGDIPNNFSEKRIFYNLLLKENEVGYISEEDKLENERIKLEDEALKQINETTAETDAPKSLHPSGVCGNLTDGIEGLN